MSTLTEVLASQQDLIRQASLALPHDFKHCTYPLGFIRQAVYLCLQCAETSGCRGLCSACSIACHTDHEQIELFPKRNFRCDCPTSAISHPCSLHTALEDANGANQYGQNFSATFCRCGRNYDVTKEKETMVQCLACEDWFHESCLNLRERPSSRENTPAAGLQDTPHVADSTEPQDDNDNTDVPDDASEASSGLPPALISGYEYESFVCGSCVSGIDTLKRWAGTRGVMMVVREDTSSPWKILEGSRDSDADMEDTDIADDAEPGQKRSRTSSVIDGPEAKRSRLSTESSTSCIAPPPSLIARNIYENRASVNAANSLGAGDIFLTEGWRGRWCRCASCLPSLEAHPYLLEEEETYEPPEDPDSGLSLEELGMRALQRLPRDKAIDGILAFNKMRDNLVEYLRPFAREGQVVKEADVRSFFETLRESTKQGPSNV